MVEKVIEKMRNRLRKLKFKINNYYHNKNGHPMRDLIKKFPKIQDVGKPTQWYYKCIVCNRALKLEELDTIRDG